MGERKHKPRLPEKQSNLVQNFKPKNKSQEELIDLIENKDIVIASGVAGSGKSYAALATALNMLGDKYKKLIIVKSVTTLPGEEIGFLKGSLEQKMEPFMFSFTWNIDLICGENSAKALMEKKLVEVLPLAFIRGITITNAIVIIDEFQNLDKSKFKSIITRIGENSKYIFLGDPEQVDLKRKEDSCLSWASGIFKEDDRVKTSFGVMEFNPSDNARHPIIPIILDILKENGI